VNWRDGVVDLRVEMPTKILTYLDSSILLNAFGGEKLETRLRALKVIGDKRRKIIASEFLRLETLPYAIVLGRQKQQRQLEPFFKNSVDVWIEDERTLFDPARQLIEQYHLQLIDALHLAAAMSVNAEFVTAEKPTNPFFAAYAKAATIYSR
jgi:predicted nucleic acid-binding protein